MLHGVAKKVNNHNKQTDQNHKKLGLEKVGKSHHYKAHSQGVQWLGHRTSTAGGTGLIPGQGTEIPKASQCSSNKQTKNNVHVMNWREGCGQVAEATSHVTSGLFAPSMLSVEAMWLRTTVCLVESQLEVFLFPYFSSQALCEFSRKGNH